MQAGIYIRKGHSIPFILFILLFCSIITVFLTSCSKTGKVNEGDCICTISFINIPKEFSMMDENLQAEFSIDVTLENITTEKQYRIQLTQDNSYSREVSLNPGIYRVSSVYSNMSSYNGIEVAADLEQVELTRDSNSEIHITITNQKEFTQHWMATQPMPEMLLADKFSRQIQINREIIPLTSILQKLSVAPPAENEKNVAPYDKISLTDSSAGVTVTLQNQTSEDASWKNCSVIGIEVFKNTVIFPEGVSLGMTPSQVCHKTTGLYGEPENFAGSILYALGFDRTSAVYSDAQSGDRITLEFSADGSYIQRICYELALFE